MKEIIMKPNFKIKHFDDYHEIPMHFHNQRKFNHYLELGCFPCKRINYGYFRYFGLFYNGRRPSLKTLMKKIDNVVYYGYPRHWHEEDSYTSKSEVEKEIKRSLK